MGVVLKKWKMGWGLFSKKVNNGCWVCKKVGLSSTQGALCTISVFFVLHFTYWGVHTHPTHPHPAYAPGHIKTTKSPPLFKHTWKTDLLQNLH